MEIDFVTKKGRYDFVIIDSAARAHLDVNDFDDMKTRYPNSSFTYIYQTSSEHNGGFLEKIRQASDIVVYIEAGIAKAKSRYTATGEYKIFDDL